MSSSVCVVFFLVVVFRPNGCFDEILVQLGVGFPVGRVPLFCGWTDSPAVGRILSWFMDGFPMGRFLVWKCVVLAECSLFWLFVVYSLLLARFWIDVG
jgi:hypothetical protein